MTMDTTKSQCTLLTYSVALFSYIPSVAFGQTLLCNSTTKASIEFQPPDLTFKEDDYSSDFGTLSGTYTLIIIFGVLLLPMTVCLRICWYRRLRRNGSSATPSHRQMDSGGNTGIPTTADIYLIENHPRGSSMTFLAAPPSYEQCVLDNPPAYDDSPPSYEQFQDEGTNKHTASTIVS